MIKRTLFGCVAALVLAPAACFAQATTATGVVGGAATGAVVGGPVGAVVGGIAGGVVGAAAEPPAEVRTYVMEERVPSVAVQEEVAVGRPLPASVEIRSIPKYEQYSYAVVNNRRVVVEPRTRKVIRVYE